MERFNKISYRRLFMFLLGIYNLRDSFWSGKLQVFLINSEAVFYVTRVWIVEAGKFGKHVAHCQPYRIVNDHYEVICLPKSSHSLIQGQDVLGITTFSWAHIFITSCLLVDKSVLFQLIPQWEFFKIRVVSFCFGSLLDTLDQQLEGRFSMPDTEVFVRQLSFSSHVS